MILGDTYPWRGTLAPLSLLHQIVSSPGGGIPGLTFWGPLAWVAKRLLKTELGPWSGGGLGVQNYFAQHQGLPIVRICRRPCGVLNEPEPRKRDHSHLLVLLSQMVL